MKEALYTKDTFNCNIVLPFTDFHNWSKSFLLKKLLHFSPCISQSAEPGSFSSLNIGLCEKKNIWESWHRFRLGPGSVTTRGWNDELWALLSRRYFALFSYSTHFTRSQQLSPQEEKTFDVKLIISVSGNFQEVIFRGNPQEEPFCSPIFGWCVCCRCLGGVPIPCWYDNMSCHCWNWYDMIWQLWQLW